MGISILIFGAFFLGLIGGSVPGPILAASFAESLRGGFLRGLRIIFRAMVSESVIALSILLLFFSFDIPRQFFYIISIFGSGVLFWIALLAWKIRTISGEQKEIFSFWKIFILTILNGPFWIFWITISVPQAFLLRQKITGGNIFFLILFEFGWLVATTFWVFIFSRFRKLLIKKNFVAIVFKIFSLLLIFFAVRLLIESITFLVNGVA